MNYDSNMYCENAEDSLEEGEYIPLERPTNLYSQSVEKSLGLRNEPEIDDDLDSPSNSDNDTDSDSDNKFKTKKLKLKSLKPFPKPESVQKKYNVWANMQEEALTETLIGCDVSKNNYDRSRHVESYDYKLIHTIQGNKPLRRAELPGEDENTSKRTRRFSSDSGDNAYFKRNCHSSDQDSNDGLFGRQRSFSNEVDARGNFKKYNNKRKFKERKNVKLRLGPKPDTNISKGIARSIADLAITVEDTEEDVARDIANKLFETKDDLIMRAVNVIGKEKAMELFNETKRIELDGGKLIMNGTRRRSPGGVFIFLVKHDEAITKEQQNQIFQEDQKEYYKTLKRNKQLMRKNKFKQLKESLNKDKGLPKLHSRVETMVQQDSHSDMDGCNDPIVKNPPPSPVTDGGRENSSDFDTHHVNDVEINEEKDPRSYIRNEQRSLPSEENKSLGSFTEDILDMSYGDAMDMF